MSVSAAALPKSSPLCAALAGQPLTSRLRCIQVLAGTAETVGGHRLGLGCSSLIRLSLVGEIPKRCCSDAERRLRGECLPLESVSVEQGGYILTDKLFFLIAICVKTIKTTAVYKNFTYACDKYLHAQNKSFVKVIFVWSSFRPTFHFLVRPSCSDLSEFSVFCSVSV